MTRAGSCGPGKMSWCFGVTVKPVRADFEWPDAADGNHLAIQHGDAVHLWQRAGKFAQALGRLGKMARAEGAREEVFDRIGMEFRGFGHNLEHGERVYGALPPGSSNSFVMCRFGRSGFAVSLVSI